MSSREGRGGSATGPADEAGGTGADGDVCDGTTAYRSPAGSFTVPTQDRVLGAARACALGPAGGEGMPVRALQHALATCYGQPVAVDGEYGGATGDAVAAAQRLHGLAVDGAYGPQTADALLWPTIAGNGAVSCVAHPG
jgi:hypothetical protein